MNYRTLNKIFAALVLAIALITYLTTLQPSVPFWDCGEFAAAAMWQQVPHPPGAPLWLMAGKTFEAVMPGDPGHNFNFFAALCSAFAAMFAYLIAVNAIERFRPWRPERPVTDYISTYAGGLIGALSFVWSDSNWFNSVESEVYSAATLLAAMAMWMVMKWDQAAENPGHERWILLFAYVMGLAIGVHLLALLIIPSFALTIYFRQYRKVTPIGLLATAAITGAAFYLLYKGTLAWIPEVLSSNAFAGVLLLAVLVGLAGWGFVKKNPVVFLAAASFTLVVLGYTTYTQILVRSAAHPVMNENEPDTFSELARYLGREQYGSRSAWPRRHDHIRGGWYEQALSQYGPLPRAVGQNPETGEIEWDDIDAGAEINYMFSYQMGKMYFRYLGWNFIGRVSDIQDAGVSWTGQASEEEMMQFIRPAGAEDVFPVTFFALPFILGLIGIVVHFRRDWRMATVFMTAFLLWGVLMALQQNQQEPQPRERDYFYTASFMVFAIWTGFGAFGLAEAFARKGREDVEGEEGVEDAPINVALAGGILGVCLLLGPLNMAYNGWTLHDRSGNWLPFDYAYNLLQSCDRNAILFTNGDNDTFPVWYLQDVAGVRRDVRVVNLELAQTPWYIWQMKNEPAWDAAPVPMTFTNEMIRDDGSGRNSINGGRGEPEQVRLSVPAEVMDQATDGQVKEAGTMTWTYTPTNGVFSPKNQIVRSIVEATAAEGWKRPIYFSVTAGNEYAGLMSFLRQEGMAYRVMPVEQQGLNLNIDVMKKSLLEPIEGDEFHTDQHYGFKFRNLNNRDVHFLGQDDHRRPINLFYHQLFITLTEQLLYVEQDRAEAIRVLDRMIELIPPDRFGPPVPYGESYSWYTKIAELYRDAGATEKAREWADRALQRYEAAMQIMQSSGVQPRYISREDYQPQFVVAKLEAIRGNFEAAIGYYEQILQASPGDQNAQLERDAVVIESALAGGDSSAARKAMQDALTSYGTMQDMRSQVLVSRFPGLMNPAFSAPDNTEVVALEEAAEDEITDTATR